jgi:hypothetical protein
MAAAARPPRPGDRFGADRSLARFREALGPETEISDTELAELVAQLEPLAEVVCEVFLDRGSRGILPEPVEAPTGVVH